MPSEETMVFEGKDMRDTNVRAVSDITVTGTKRVVASDCVPVGLVITGSVLVVSGAVIFGKGL